MRILPLTLILALLAAAPAAADPPWSAPVDVGPPSQNLLDPAIEIGGSGRALISWRWFDQLRSDTNGRLVSRHPSGAFGAVSEAPLVARPAVYGRGRALFLLGSGRFPRITLTAAYGSSGGLTPGARTVIARRRRIVEDPVLAAREPRGEGAAAWIERTGGVSRLMLSERRRARPFGRARKIASGGVITGLRIAYGERGDLMVAFQQVRVVRRRSVRTVRVRVRAPSGRWGAVQTAGPSRGIADIALDVAPDGRAVLAWGTQDGGEEASRPWEVRAAVRAPRARRFARAQLLDPGDAAGRSVGRVRASVAARGAATVAWSGVRGTNPALPSSYPVRVASTGAGGSFGTHVEIEPSGAVGDLARGPGGELLLVWSRFGAGPLSGPARIVAARRAPGQAAFAAAEAVSGAEAAIFPDAEYDPASGRPFVVWIAGAAGGAAGQVRLASRP